MLSADQGDIMQTLTHATMQPYPGPHEAAQMQRIRAEYVDMPGLNLTVAQAARLWGVSIGHAERLLSEMVDERFLERDARGLYRRRGCRRCW